ncbi:MAG: hypothetical protein ACYC6J_00815 [Coriobacteriia bacterium]
MNIDFADIWPQALALLMDPASDLLAALVLYGVITLVLLIAVVAAIMFLMASPEEEGESFSKDDFYDPEEEGRPGELRQRPEPASVPPPEVSRTPRSRIATLGITALVVIASWVAAGFTTSVDIVCTSCHLSTPHSEVDSTVVADPHVNTACVSCHEPGGIAGRYFWDVPGRLAHFVDGAGSVGLQEEYGRITQAACLSCHRPVLAGEVSSPERGLRMSHAEPYEASMRCIDCHTASQGVVTAHDAGMNPCLRCHDSKTASAECDTCHDKGAAAAARARTTQFARPQIAQVTCGGCHDEERECDSCHGIRMPHSRQFMAVSHARAGAVDYWVNGGRGCAKCHTPTRRPCTRCHALWPGQGHPRSLIEEHKSADEARCDTCHQSMAPTNSRRFCIDMCHTESAMRESPR